MDAFRNYVNALDAEMAKKELSDLYQNFEVVRDYFNMKLSDGRKDNRTIRKYKDRIIDALYLDSNFQGGLDIETVDKVMKSIKKNPNYFYFIEVGLFAVQECTWVANQYGGRYGEAFYAYFETLFKEVAQCIEAREVKRKYRDKADDIQSNAFEGYDHRDQLSDIFEKYFE